MGLFHRWGWSDCVGFFRLFLPYQRASFLGPGLQAYLTHHFLPTATHPLPIVAEHGIAGTWGPSPTSHPHPPPVVLGGQEAAAGRAFLSVGGRYTQLGGVEGSLETPPHTWEGYLPSGPSLCSSSGQRLQSPQSPPRFSRPIPPSHRDKRKECLRADSLGVGGGRKLEASGEGISAAVNPNLHQEQGWSFSGPRFPPHRGRPLS